MSDNTVVDLDEKRKASQLPRPCGYVLLIALPEKEDKTEGGVYVPEDLRDREYTATISGMVLRMGPDAYGDKKRFPSGPYCKVGDWITMKSYTGDRLVIHGQELRLINDDSVRSVVEDPRGVKRA